MTVIDGATNSVIATVTVGPRPQALCYNPSSNKVYCASSDSSNVTVIDGATNSVLATVAAGSQAFGPLLQPAEQQGLLRELRQR